MAVIHKRYRADGVADLAAWTFECDGCHTTTSLLTVRRWHLPPLAFRRDDTTTRTYCAACRDIPQTPLFTDQPTLTGGTR